MAVFVEPFAVPAVQSFLGGDPYVAAAVFGDVRDIAVGGTVVDSKV